MKQITDAKNVCHLFAHQMQNELAQWQIEKNGCGFKTSNGSLFSVKNELYSYGYHFCMAKIYHIQSRELPTVFVSNRTYSVTTSKHQRYLDQAINYMDVVYVAYPNEEPSFYPETDRNFKAFRNELYSIREQLGKAKKPEKYVYPLLRAIENLEKYVRYMTMYILTGDKLECLKPYEDLINEFNKLELEKDAKNFETKRKEKLMLQCSKYFPILNAKFGALWENYGGLLSDEEKGKIELEYSKVPNEIEAEYKKQKGDFLRVTKDGQSIETSLGVIVPINEAKAGYLAFKAGKLLGYKFAGYSVTQSDAKGFKAGCHTIKAETINKIALQLNWK